MQEPRGTRTIRYDDNGNVLTVADSSLLASGPLYTFSYDPLNRVEDATAHFIPGAPLLRSAYDPFGNRKSLTLDPAGENLVHEWTHNRLDQLAVACFPQDQQDPPIPCTPTGTSETLRLLYADNDDLSRITHGNGLETDFTYLPEGPIDTITVGTAPLLGLDYGVDGVLNVRSIAETIAGTVQSPAYGYAYDGVYRLTHASYPSGAGYPPAAEAFGYDAAGNRDDDPESATPWAYDANNRIEASPGSPAVSYGFDDDGNLTSRTEGAATRTLAWDATNRLRQVVDSATGTSLYDPDPFGRRIRKTTGGTTDLLPENWST